MNFELQRRTAAGQRFVVLTASHAADFARRAENYDCSGNFPFENLAAIQRSGVMAACVPEELDGLRVASIQGIILKRSCA